MASQWLGAYPPPPGVEPNFIDPPSQFAGTIAAHTALTATFTGLAIKCSKMGIGRHIWNVPAPWITEALKWVCQTHVPLFYRRLFSQHPKMKYTVAAGIAFVSIFHSGLFFATIFACDPIARQWDISIPGKCNNPEIPPYLSGAVSSVTDIFVLLLPVPLVWNLHAPMKKKVGVLAVFSVGVFVCAASLVRLGMTPVLRSNFDATWNISTMSLWATLEVNIGIVCGCSMLFPAFFKRRFPNFAVGSILQVLRSRISGVSRKGSSDSSDSPRFHHEQWKDQKHIYGDQVDESSCKQLANVRAGANIV
ncbi:hypothetical protein PG985_000848 [Apiospora marii]|uniref:uncharacterized protein n=1 Tax=Apiospora marii TaxID=335849 RepID=UPI0031320A44